ncbi:MAG: GatB/YqeY domain-containing protein [Hyphomonadaceae bacterium]
MGAEILIKEQDLRGRLKQARIDAEAADHDGVEAATLRLILCAVDDRDVTARQRGECSGCAESTVRELLGMMATQREVSAREYDEAGRIVEAERERAELAILRSFLPQKLSGEALEKAVAEIIEEVEADRLKDVGRCMDALKARYPGQIDSASAGKIVRSLLQAPAE